MKLIKNICITVAVLGFILALGTAGTSDLEMETGQILMTEAQFYLRMLIGFIMLVGGAIGTKVCSIIMEGKKSVAESYRRNIIQLITK